MTKMRQALFTQLKWQLHALTQQLHSIEQQLTELDQAIQLIEQTISTSSVIPSMIIPEHEIARVHFIAYQHQKHNELKTNKVPLLEKKTSLTALKIQCNTELKRLEKHQERLLKIEQSQMILTQQNNSDEWTIQRREGV